MNKFILLLVLVCGFLSGYLVGDYRGKDARETLEKALETGKELEREHKAAAARLKTELDGIHDKHRRELAAIHKNNAARTAEWRRAKVDLDDAIKHSNARLAAFDKQLRTLVARRDAASGSERARLDLEIASLRKERDDLRRKVEGDLCLQTRIPQSVFQALNETDTAGSKQ